MCITPLTLPNQYAIVEVIRITPAAHLWVKFNYWKLCCGSQCQEECGQDQLGKKIGRFFTSRPRGVDSHLIIST